MADIAVINEVHNVAFRIQALMMSRLGFTVYAAGESFHGVAENYHWSRQQIPEVAGVMEFNGMPQDAVFLDTHPKTILRLRERGWHGPVLIVWQMPVGPDWVKENLKVEGKVGSLAWSAAVGRGLREMGNLPSEYFWPPYYGDALDQSARQTHGDYLVTVVENAAGWSNVGVLQKLRDDARTRLELYGGGPPDWARKVPQHELFSRIRGSRAMYHLKPFDTPGLAVMEAAFQGVPLIFPPDWIRCTETEFFKDGESCVVVETKEDLVVQVAERLADAAENRRIGHAGRQRMLEETDWNRNGPRLRALIDRIRAM